ncbi:disks large-associated protein 4 isoform X1 [Micropterus salmoides]|uniref:disks large-associated protein 4 isoform X1 n=1 Tax=Micropterus salmoides TaxID=27706 RepID=UPI0018ED7E8E|nr:disks large-associated protein 4 isoform X1 [Micropterus salmoides]XP_045932225.1 disks large-associated protein 4 isoform X1 [Micropterus dolomieu]XP_045932226.1 disks large-associated protein 4 isoform X1 [Micropterus dolomieu]XP_045932228.1 disks large-associated protein 4 isoform X1 [Micropterus dolomieu]XP_045932229.1 disks large-associated protein 4 isoform X1 [Micropterus dolomieu]XP_045932230.1 disks large-associated protein 4 isoform X1 [Micropterus dolomieu]
MKGLGTNRNRHLSDSCEPSPGHPEALYPPRTSTLTRSPYLLSPTMEHYGTMDPHLYPSANPGSLPPDCMLPLNNQLSNSSTFPRIHYNSYDQSDFSPPGDSIGGISTGTMGTSMSMGMGMGTGMGMAGLSGRTPMITSGSATISHHMTKNQAPTSLLEFDKQLPGGRDGFSTLQFHRTSAVAAAKQRTDSPGRIRYMLHSVQKLFAKSQSLESHNMKGNVNGRSTGSGGGSSGTEDGGKQNRRSKSKDRGTKSEATAKRRPRSNMSGYWSSDDLDSSDLSSYHNTMAMMTLGRPTGHDSQGGQNRYIHSGYNTISSSKTSNDLKYQPLSVPGGGGGGGLGETGRMVINDNDYMKGGSWSTLTMGQPRQVIQKGSATLDRSMLKSKSCQQELTCNYLQVGRRGDWSSTLGRSGGANEIPCRRMRSGSYVKAMGDMEDSDDSEGSPKPSPKGAARRQSYLRATQQSLSDQLPPRNCLPSLRELSNNRSLDNLDCIGETGSSLPRWDDDDFSQACSTLGRRSCMEQLRDLEMSHHYEDRGSESTYRDSRSQSQDNPEPPDLPMPTCFRSRSHSYLRAIQAGCSQDDDTASIDSGCSPPLTDTTVRTYSSSTDNLSTQWKTWKEQFGSYLIAAGLDKAPKEKQLAICLQRLGTDRPRILPTRTVSTCITTCKKTAPPPVPPRTTSKPYISVTVQSSTESAQDNYLDQQDRRSEVNSQSSHAHSNSSDSLDSTRANSLARGIPRPPHIIPTPIATPREPIAPTTTNASTETSDSVVQHESLRSGFNKGNLVAEEPLVAPVPRRKLSSIGIQVDCIQEDPREETPPLAKFQSIGVQVEDGWQLSRSSSMASKQETDSDTQDIPVISHINNAKHSEKKIMVSSASQSMSSPPGQDYLDNGDTTGDASSPPPPRQILNRSTTRSSSSSFSESLDPALDPSSLPPPDPWLDSGNGSNSSVPQSGGGGTLCRRDGHWFLKLLQAETGRMEGWCQQMEQETKDNQLSEEVLGKVRSAVGSAQLLISQKFQQFRGLCEQNLNVNANPRPTAQDLAGFWDLLQLSIEDISLKFDELYHLKSNDWQPVPSAAAQSPPERKDEEKVAPPASKKPGKGRPLLGREKSADSSSTSSSASAEKQRQEARKRLLAAKKAASFRQNSATESADSIEIYVPEAQTRL